MCACVCARACAYRNGRMAMLGFVGILLLELLSGKGIITGFGLLG
jgi:hypothetical protein